MGDSANSSVSFRRRLAIGSGTLLTLASLFPLSVSAAPTANSSPHSSPTSSPKSAPSSSPKSTPSSAPKSSPTSSPTGSATTAGLVSNITTALPGQLVNSGDYVSSGWAISMTGKHPAATVDVTSIVATIPVKCEIDGKKAQLLNLVVQVPHSTLTIAANDTAWHPTPGVADATGYEAKILVGELCHGGALVPNGKATYAAKLVSTDTTDPFAVRFHSVDARTNVAPKSKPNPNTDCTSATQNKTGVAQCKAAWTPLTTAYAVAPPTTSGGGTGTGTGGVTGTVNGVTGTVAGLVGNILTPPPIFRHAVHSVLHHRTRSSRSAAQGSVFTKPAQPGGVSGATTQPAPVLILPAPSQSAVLGPVPLPVPVIDSVAAGVGGALPWNWFLLLAVLDLGLIVAIVVRRRIAQHDRLNPQ